MPAQASAGTTVLPGGYVPPSYAPASYAPTSAPGLGASPSDPLHWVFPTGRNWQSITAGYVALFAIVIWVLGPIALGLGVAGLRASARGNGHGRGRAVFAVVVGSLATLAMLAFVVAGDY